MRKYVKFATVTPTSNAPPTHRGIHPEDFGGYPGGLLPTLRVEAKRSYHFNPCRPICGSLSAGQPISVVEITISKRMMATEKMGR